MKRTIYIWALMTPLGFAQGPLTPPAAPAPTMKTLSQIEPRIPITNVPVTITQPGSYYLTTNIVYSGSNDGIRIATNNVTIDLNGYTLDGSGSSSYDGITDPPGLDTYHDITIRNGTIQAWSYGIKLSAIRCHLENLIIVSNYYSGADVSYNSVVEGCSFVGNGDYGFFGFGPITIERCTAERNGRQGFYLIQYGVIKNSSSVLNGEEGIIATTGGTIIHCSVANNFTNGISVDNGCTVDQCSVANNYGVGILAEDNCSIKNCAVSGNRMHGISVSNNNLVADNLCVTNGLFSQTGAGILVAGQGNRIENNALTRNDYGLRVTRTSNFIARNTAYGNPTNYSVAAGNSLAGIANVAGISFTNTNPWCNFEY